MRHFLVGLFVSLIVANMILTVAQTNDTSSTADSSSSSTAADPGNSTTNSSSSSSTGSSSNATIGNCTSSNSTNGTVCRVDFRTVFFNWTTCGVQYVVNDTLGHYPNGKPWPNVTEPDYMDLLNNGSYVSRGYKQCGGGSTAQNCLDKFAATTAYPERRYCGNGTGTNAVFTRGEVSPDICFVISGSNRLFRVIFNPLVDQFALLQVVDSFAGFAGSDTVENSIAEALTIFGHYGTAFQVEINGIVSDFRHRYSYTASLESTFTRDENGTYVSTDVPGQKMCIVVPFWTIVVKMTNGVIDSIEFDDDDTTCDTDHSVDGNCATELTKCEAAPVFAGSNNLNSTDCDFKVYVSWQGTDSAGTFLTSSGRRLSQFRRWSLSAAYNQASSFDTGELPAVQPANPDL